MTGGSPVTSRQMHRCFVRARDVRVARASLFPFFDRDGAVRTVMLTWARDRRIRLLTHDPGRFRMSRSGILIIDAELGREEDFDLDRASEVDRLWHFDPWWVLRAPHHAGHPAVPLLAESNCAQRFEREVRNCSFGGDLSHVKAVQHAGYGGWSSYRPDLLPFRDDLARPPKHDPGWSLRPLWEREWPPR